MDVVHVPLSGKYAVGKTAVIDPDDADRILCHAWYVTKEGGRREVFYARSTRRLGSSRSAIKMHRLILRAGKNDHVDHINGNGLDNRKSNLRVVDHRSNMWNCFSVRSRAGFKGVHSRGKAFVARISKDRVRYSLGVFDSAVEAAMAYDAKAIELYGDFACTNRSLGLY